MLKQNVTQARTRRASFFVVPRIAADDETEEVIEYDDFMGGIISFSTEVNVGIETLKQRVEAKLKTWWNQHRRLEKLHDIVVMVKKKSGEKGIGYTSNPHKLEGVYESLESKTYRENSYTIEIQGIDTATLNQIADGIRKAFNQESVRVKNYNTMRTYSYYGYRPKKKPTGELPTQTSGQTPDSTRYPGGAPRDPFLNGLVSSTRSAQRTSDFRSQKVSRGVSEPFLSAAEVTRILGRQAR